MPRERSRIGPWAKATQKVARFVFRVEIGESGGTAFVISLGRGKNAPTHGLLLATAYHVIRDASKTKPLVKLSSQDDSVILDSTDNEISLFRLGPSVYDTGLIVVQMPQPLFQPRELPPLLPHSFKPPRGAELGWLGFPSIVWPEMCFFHGAVAGYVKDPEAYLIDGVGINGVSGGPAFNREGVIFGLVSTYMPNKVDKTTTLPGLMSIVPIAVIDYWLKNILKAKPVLYAA